MKTVKFMTAVALMFMVTASFASNKVVKSKLGDIELTNQKDGGSVGYRQALCGFRIDI